MKGSVLGYLFFLFSAVLHLLAAVLPYWQTNDPTGAVIEWREVNIGLWHQCVGYTTGIFTCDGADSVWLGQPTYIITARATMLIALLCDLVAFCIFQVAAPWNSCLDSGNRPKLMLITGCLTLFSMLMVLIGSGYYGSQVLSDYMNIMTNLYNRDSRGMQISRLNTGGEHTGVMVFGGSLYCLWVSLFSGLIGGIIIVRTRGSSFDDYEDEYYDPTVIRHNQNSAAQPLPYKTSTLPNNNFQPVMHGHGAPNGGGPGRYGNNIPMAGQKSEFV